MAVEIGMATSHSDLLLKLEKFLTTNSELVAAKQQWESLQDNTAAPYSLSTTPNNNGYLMSRFFKGKGLDGQDSIIVPMVLRQNVASNYYTLSAYPARAYARTKFVEQQFVGINGNNTYPACMSIWQTNMKYWFIANGRRFIIIAKVANRYVSMYCGLFLPSGTDTEYSYPLYIGGNHGTDSTPYTYESTSNQRSFFNPQSNDSSIPRSSAYLILPSGELACGDNYDGTSFSSNVTYQFGTYPYNNNHYLTKTIDGQYLLLPIDIVQTRPVMQHLGWLDGVFYVSGFENSPENIVQVAGVDYICIPAVVQNDYNNYAAIALK